MRMYFLDSTDNEKYEYNQHGFARFHNQIIGSGVSDVNSLEVSAKTNMDVGIGSGWIFSNGFSLELEESETVTHDISDPTNDRIDRVIIRFDTNPEERRFYPVILKGTPSSNPIPPSLTRDNYIQEMSLAQVRIVAGKSYIEQSQITDERADDSVCGYIPLHNIYRGLEVDEAGRITMPNQSYVEVVQAVNINFPDRVDVPLPFQPVVRDTQNETSERSFTAKSSGSYMVFVYIAFSEGDLTYGGTSASDVQALYAINGESQGPVFARTCSDYKDNIFSGSTVHYLKKGDELVINAHIKGAPSGLTMRNHRIKIAKIN